MSKRHPLGVLLDPHNATDTPRSCAASPNGAAGIVYIQINVTSN